MKLSGAQTKKNLMAAFLAENIAAGRIFARNEKVFWRCRNCGYLHEGSEAPHMCPACAHPQAHFELFGENW
jgi:rubrerythrin